VTKHDPASLHTAAPDAKTRRPTLGYSVYGAVTLIFALNGTVSKSIMQAGMSAEHLAQMRSTSAFLVLVLLTAALRPSGFRVTRRELGLLAAYGVFGVTMTNYLYFIAIKELPVGIALVLEFTAPIWIALWMRFAQKRAVRRQIWLGIALALVGLVLVAQVWRGMVISTLGLTAGFGAAAALTIYYLIGEKIAHQRDPLSLTMWSFGFSSLFWALVQPWQGFPWHLLGEHAHIPTRGGTVTLPVSWLVAYMVILGTVVAFSGVNFALRHLTAGQAGLFGMMEPVLASVIAWLALGENLLAVQILGGALILAGIATAEFSRSRANPASTAVAYVD